MKSLKKSNFRRGKIKNSKRKKLIGGNYNVITNLLLETHDSLETMVKMYYDPLGQNIITKEFTEVVAGVSPSNVSQPAAPTEGLLDKITEKVKDVAKKATGKFSITKDKKQPKQEVKKKSSITVNSNKPRYRYSGIEWPEKDTDIYL